MSGWILDTNVLSELRKGQRTKSAVKAWADAQPAHRLFVSRIWRVSPSSIHGSTEVDTAETGRTQRNTEMLFPLSPSALHPASAVFREELT